MSLLDVAIAPVRPGARPPFWRPATVLWSLGAVVLLLLLALQVLAAGYIRQDVVQLQAGDAWRSGGWLSQVMLRAVGLMPGAEFQHIVLAVAAALISGLCFGALYDRLRSNGWFRIGAFAVLTALLLHAGVLYTLTASAADIPLYIAFAALIPSIRALEEVGDVQSAIGLGLLLPLLLLASPAATVLILPLAFASALADPDARRDPRAYVAMLLVTVLPTIIVALGIVGFIAQSGLDLAEALLPYANAYAGMHFDADTFQSGLAALLAFAPVLLVPLLYCIWPDLTERREAFSALAVVGLPLYLVLARATLNTEMAAIVPPLALLAAFVSWLTVVRLPLSLRVLSLMALALAVMTSWGLTGLWDAPLWKTALFSALPTDLRGLWPTP
jgi:hypothetical protein